ncbi:hypothetical protein PspLS_11634, partial [Pyricularia sp. CBS 133598]
SSARVAELCGAKYKDLVLLIGWKDGEAELKLKVRRAICKGKNNRQAYYARKDIVKLRPAASVFTTNALLAGKHYLF